MPSPDMTDLTHPDERGRAPMLDIGDKPPLRATVIAGRRHDDRA